MPLAVMKEKLKIPDKLKSFVKLGFDYDESRVSGGNQAFADCIFCGKTNKLYINIDSGQWDCKSCGEHGNTYTFMQMWYDLWLAERNTYKKEFVTLANDRQLPPEVLKQAGIIFDGNEFAIPIYNSLGKLSNVRFYNYFAPLPRGKKKHALWGLPKIPAQLYGVEVLSQKGRSQEPIYICAGEWDKIALQYLLTKEGREGIPLAPPGEEVWKAEWTDFVIDREVIGCYDNGPSGEKGTERLYSHIHNRVKSFEYIRWQEGLPDGYDIRDLVTRDFTLADITDMIEPYFSIEEKDKLKEVEVAKRKLSNTTRPTWEEVREVYSKHLHMSEDLWDALKVIYAVILTVNVPENPLWMHIVGAPGIGKTELIMSISTCSASVLRSTLSPNSLVSGFVRNEDPSLLPRLNGKVLVVKDGTEILSLSREDKERVLSTLRGAYDGSAFREYGNGQIRDYKDIHFNVVFGVTQKIYEERSASMGDRFLIIHIMKGDDLDQKLPTKAAIRNIRKKHEDQTMRKDLQVIAEQFLEVNVSEDDFPDIEEWVEDRIVALAQLLATLRANVERDPRTRKLLVRPYAEMPTRIATQVTKLIMGLSLLNDPPSVGDEEIRIATRVVIDSCVGFNLEALASLVAKPGQTMLELSEDCNLPMATLKDQVEDLIELGAIRQEKGISTLVGRKPHLYYPTERMVTIWREAGLTRENNGKVRSTFRQRRKLKIRMVKRRS